MLGTEADHREKSIPSQRRRLVDGGLPLQFAQADTQDAAGKFFGSGCVSTMSASTLLTSGDI
jgi:hypothetical protein